MVKIKVSTSSPLIPYLKQTPGGRGIIGKYQFFVNEDTPDADWWVVVHGVPQVQHTLCPKENTILFTQEAESVKRYQPSFVRQFHWIVTCQESLKHPRKIYNQQGHQSYLFMKRIAPGQNLESYRAQFKNYDELRAMTPSDIPKSKIMTTVASHKQRTEGAVKRHEFIKKIKEHFGERFDIYCNVPGFFGPETKVAGYKWDAVAPYKYVLSIENDYVPHWWTNHLFDAFIAGAYPIFYGHPSIFQYFPEGALTLIDLNDVPKAIQTIEKVISENYYEKHIDDIWAARRLTLDKYNLLQTIADVIDKLPAGADKKQITVKPERDRMLEWKQAAIKKISNPLLRGPAKIIYHSYRRVRYGERWSKKHV